MLSSHSKKYSLLPVFTDWLWEKKTFNIQPGKRFEDFPEDVHTPNLLLPLRGIVVGMCAFSWSHKIRLCLEPSIYFLQCNILEHIKLCTFSSSCRIKPATDIHILSRVVCMCLLGKEVCISYLWKFAYAICLWRLCAILW